MKKTIVAASILLVFTYCSNTKMAAPVEAETKGKGAKAKWIKLFDGKTTAGWHSYGETGVNPLWKVENGTLTLDETIKKGHGDIVTDNEYGNFDLKLEWKIAKNGNSGIIFFVHEDPSKYKNTYETGLEMQVLDNDGHADGKIIKHRAGDLYDLVSVNNENAKPVGEWNKVEIKSLNGKLELYMNGNLAVTTTLWNDDWKAMVAKSKFKSMPAFGTYQQGKIALQYHGDKVWYRNIEIKAL